MPPAFNLSQDQTLQFKPVTVFGLFRTRSLTQRTDEVFNHLSMAKPSFHYCVRLDTFASRPAPEKTPQPGARRASSAHTYRLLVFKDRFAHFTAPTQPPGTASFCVAASAAEKRDYEDSLSVRQPHFFAFA